MNGMRQLLEPTGRSSGPRKQSWRSAASESSELIVGITSAPEAVTDFSPAPVHRGQPLSRQRRPASPSRCRVRQKARADGDLPEPITGLSNQRS